MTGDEKWAASVNASKIGVLGFSLGGSTALELIGGRADLNAYADYCDRYTMMMDCQWFAGGFGFVDGKRVASPVVKLREFDKAHFEQSNLDPRITSAVIVDPVLPRPSMATVSATSSAGDDHQSRQPWRRSGGGLFLQAVRRNSWRAVPPDIRRQSLQLLAVCKPGAQDFLSEAGDVDPICDGKGLRDRAEVHKDAEKLVLEAFENTLK